MPYKDPAMKRAYMKKYTPKYAAAHRETESVRKLRWTQRMTSNGITNKRVEILKRYGLTLFEFNRRSDNQGFACAICRQTPEEPATKKAKTLHIDHCHRTRKVRGLLCRRCNSLLGHAQDSITTLQNAIQYLLDNQ